MDFEVSKLKFDREVEYLTSQGSTAVAHNGWRIGAYAYPILDVVFNHQRTSRDVGFRFHCEGWDEQPPSLVLFDPKEPDKVLTWDQWPKGGWNAGVHPRTNGPFLCLPGIREYHTHDSHLDHKWEALRPLHTYGLRYILERVYQKFGTTDG